MLNICEELTCVSVAAAIAIMLVLSVAGFYWDLSPFEPTPMAKLEAKPVPPKVGDIKYLKHDNPYEDCEPVSVQILSITNGYMLLGYVCENSQTGTYSTAIRGWEYME